MAAPDDPRQSAGSAPRRSQQGSPSRRPADPRPGSTEFQEQVVSAGNQVWNAVQGAIESQEFANLSTTVGSVMGQAAQGITEGLSQAGDTLRKGQQQYQMQQTRREQEAQRRQELARIEARYGSPGGLAATGVIMGITGGILTFDFALAALVALASAQVEVFVVCVVLTALCVWLLSSGVKRSRQAKRFRQYRRVIGSDEMVPIKTLAHQTNASEAATLAMVRKLLDRGLFVEGALDDTESTLLVTRSSYAAYRRARDHRREQLARQAAEKSAPARPAEDVRVEVVEDTSKLSPEARALKKQGDAYLAQLREADVAIEDEAVSAKIVQIEAVVSKIIEHATQNPQVIDDLGQLMNYYLPMTVKLLRAYQDLDAQPVQGENITSSKREIEATLDTLSRAFENLLDDVFKDMTWDVSTDISVLHAVLAQEGLIDDPFSAKGGAAGGAGTSGSEGQAFSANAGAAAEAAPQLTLNPDLSEKPRP